MKSIQQYFMNNSQEVVIPQELYKGPLVISRSCVVDGGNSILWAKKGPVLVIDAPNVVVKNLSVELIEKNDFGFDKAAIKCNYSDARFSNVSVIGEVKGLSNEPDWNLPVKFDLGSFLPNTEIVREFRIRVGARTTVACQADGIKIYPTVLEKGDNTVSITVFEHKAGDAICGDICLKTGGLMRKIAVCGQVDTRIEGGQVGFNNTPRGTAPTFGTVQMPTRTVTPPPTRTVTPPPTRTMTPPSTRTMTPPPIQRGTLAGGRTKEINEVRRGQRLPITSLDIGNLTVSYSDMGKSAGVGVELYAFELNKDGKLTTLKDIVSMQNDRTFDGAVRMIDSTSFNINLKKTGEYVDKIAICCVVGGGVSENKKVFSNVRMPSIEVGDSNRVYKYTNDATGNEKSLVMIELYRYNDSWKLNVVGMGYARGYEHLKEMYKK
ncbi:MAG: TerD family protein [Clostridia bacterium]|nr:TerD family protein [Clostridia bacterium]